MDSTPTEAQWIAEVLQAEAEGRADAGRQLLQQCLQHHPASAPAHYLMATDRAEAGDPEGALGHFATALRTEPLLHEARLQWALLLLTLGRDTEAAQVLAGFDEARLHPAIHAYQEALRLVARGQGAAALERLQAGLGLRHANAPLNGDMQRLAGHIAERLHAMAAGGAAAPAAAPAAVDGNGTPQAQPETHYLFNAYRTHPHDT
jgi:tetratricopeptide (TPR) repeat protein